MASATPAPDRSLLHRWTLSVWRAVGSVRILVLVALTISSLMIFISLWTPIRLDVAALGEPLGAVMRSMVNLFTGSPPGARFARLVLALVSAVACLQLLTLVAPGWSPLPLGARTCASCLMTTEGETLHRTLARAFGAAGQTIFWREKGGLTRHAHARRRGVRHWLLVALPVGFLVLVVSLAVQVAVGWSAPPQDLVLGESVVLNAAPKVVVRLDELAIAPGADALIDVLGARVAVSANGHPEVLLDLRPKAQTVHRGVTFVLARYGPAMKLVATSADGQQRDLRLLMGDGQPRRVMRVPFPDEQQDKWLSVSDMGLILRLLLYGQNPQGSLDGPSVHIQVIRGRDGKVLEERFVSSAQHMTVEGLDLDVGLEYFVTVAARYAPHRALTWAGAALVLLGLLGWILWPPREAWVVLEQNGDEGTWCHVCVRRPDRDAQWFRCFWALLSSEGEGLHDDPPAQRSEAASP